MSGHSDSIIYGVDRMESPDLLLPGGGSAEGVDTVLHLRILLWRHKWIVLGVFVLLSGLAIPAVWLLVKPEYESKALVRVAPVVPRVVFATEANRMLPLYKNYLNTQVATIRSPKVLERVLDREEVKQSHWYREEGRKPLRNPIDPLDRLVKTLRVEPLRDTELIAVSMNCGRSADAKLIVDAVVAEYLKLMDSAEETLQKEIRGQVWTKYQELQNQLKGLREAKRKVTHDSGLMDSAEVRVQLGTKLNEMEFRYWELDAELAAIEARLGKGNKEEGEAGVGEEESADAGGQVTASRPAEPEFSDDPEWWRLKRKVEEARQELEQAKHKWGNQHSAIKDLESRLAYAGAQLQEWETVLKEKWSSGSAAPGLSGQESVVDSARVALEQEEQERRARRGKLEEYIGSLQGKVKNAWDIAFYDEEIRRKEREFEDVHRRLVELETESKAPGRVEIASQGLMKSEPNKDRRMLLTVMALGAAMMGGLGLAYFRGIMDPRIHETGDLAKSMDAPFVGRLPLLRERKLPGELEASDSSYLFGAVTGSPEDPTDAAFSGFTALMEQTRMLRTMLLECASETGSRTLLVTGPTAATGKTSVALLLARSLAVIGKRVLLVDTDFHRPCLHQRMRLEPGGGLARLLSKTATDAEAIQASDLPHLDVVPAGKLEKDFSSEALANGVFKDCLRRWNSVYDLVILDSSPILPTANARILAGHCDGTILVVKASHSRREDALEAYRQMSTSRSGVIGIVLIGDRHTDSYSYQSYQYLPQHSLSADPASTQEGDGTSSV